MEYKLVLLRHGESEWNKQNRFTGWTDVELSEKGVQEAVCAGQNLEANGFVFDIAFTSILKRAIDTLTLLLQEMQLSWIPVYEDWRLNERHYGALQGLNKSEMAKKYGEEQVHIWRRSFDVRPPELRPENLKPGEPSCESLKDTIQRVMPLWSEQIVPLIKDGKKIIISAHGNSLRALVKHIDGISDEDIPNLEIPTGQPLIYELNKKMEPVKKYYLKGV